MKGIKKFLLENIKVVLAFILGIVISGVTVYAATILFAASDVSYDNSKSSLTSTNVQGAIDELYVKAVQKEKLCKKGYYTTSDGSSDYTCTKIDNIITLTLKGSGEQKFINSDFINYGGRYPDKVYIDGTLITPTPTYSYNFASDEVHQVIMIWDDNLNTTEKMFYKCPNIISIDLSNFDTSSVTNMSYMFYDCYNLLSLNLSSFDTSSVTNMSFMFYDCSNLSSLDLSSFDTSSVTNMSYMFCYCTILRSLDLSSFDTSSVTDMISMFYYCYNLRNLDLSSFDTSNVTRMDKMFVKAPNGLTIKSNTSTCNKIASDSGITASYTCGP